MRNDKRMGDVKTCQKPPPWMWLYRIKIIKGHASRESFYGGDGHLLSNACVAARYLYTLPGVADLDHVRGITIITDCHLCSIQG